jgi:hypothetical protein
LSKRARKFEALYNELTAPPQTTVTEMDIVMPKVRGNSSRELQPRPYLTRRVVSINDKPIKVKKQKPTTCDIKSATWKDNDGEVKPIRHTEWTEGDLYSARTSNSKIGIRYTYEWALTFVADCDLARQRGNLNEILEEYASDETLSFIDVPETEVIPIRELYQKKSGVGRPINSNYDDMLDRYKNEPEALKWIKDNARDIQTTDEGSGNGKNFYHDEYMPQVIRKSVRYGEDENMYSDATKRDRKGRTGKRLNPDTEAYYSEFRVEKDKEFFRKFQRS